MSLWEHLWEMEYFGRNFGAPELFSLFIGLSVIMISVVIFYENQRPEKTIAWLLILLVFPVFGFFLYLFFGHKFRKIRRFRKKRLLSVREFKRIFEEGRGRLEDAQAYIETWMPEKKKLLTLLHNMEDAQLSFRNATQVYLNGNDTFAAFLEAIDGAKDHIHMEFYIFNDDATGRLFQDRLIARAREGVEVRIIYDGMGNFGISRDFIQRFKENGIQVVCFSPVFVPVINNRINYRNHRKIMVVDGLTSFVGGFNIGDEYRGGAAGFTTWRDTHLRIQGEASRHLQNIFVEDWFFLTGEKLEEKRYYPEPEEDENRAVIHVVKSGPDSQWESIMQMYFAMITNARRNLYITTPYFIPGESILQAITNAALAGIDVRLLVPARADYRLMTWATSSYMRELVEAGVRVYTYDPSGFVHAKTLIVDGEIASVGTANLDVRSFSMNFEINAFVYNRELAATLTEHFFRDLEHSREITPQDLEKKTPVRILLESLAKLFSPLL